MAKPKKKILRKEKLKVFSGETVNVKDLSRIVCVECGLFLGLGNPGSEFSTECCGNEYVIYPETYVMEIQCDDD